MSKMNKNVYHDVSIFYYRKMVSKLILVIMLSKKKLKKLKKT